MRLDGQEGVERGRDSVRFRQRREMAAVGLQNAPEARGTAVAVAERV